MILKKQTQLGLFFVVLLQIATIFYRIFWYNKRNNKKMMIEEHILMIL